MIHEITSTLPSFKTLKFSAGLNIVIATKSLGATEKQSRNGAGKTSLVELIHFLLGSDARKNGIFRSTDLRSYNFSMKLDLYGSTFKVSRSGAKPSKVLVEGDCRLFPSEIKAVRELGEQEISNEVWKAILGNAFFDLPISTGSRYAPTFRLLFPYFSRRQESDGFSIPLQHTQKQPLYQQQVAVSRLLNLDEQIAQDFEEYRVRKKLLNTLTKAAKTETLGSYIGSSSIILRDLALAEKKVRRIGAQVQNFRIVEEYETLENEADILTQQISSINDEITMDLKRVSQIEEFNSSETPPDVRELQKVYGDLGVIMPEIVAKRYEDVLKFHEAVIRNRRKHLATELDIAQERVRSKRIKRGELDTRRKQIMDILSSGGALAHYTKLTEELARTEGEVRVLTLRLKDAERIENTKTELQAEQVRIFSALQTDYSERANFVKEAVVAYEALSEALYKRAGQLTINPTQNGLEINFAIAGQRSKGISNMQIFCFDLMLMDLVAKRGIGTGFLVHDSHLYDGVDERQIARAIQLGAKHSKEYKYQYIVTMNSDAVPRDGFDQDFRIDDYFNDVRLTDAAETGGLFGIRFG